jgi:hypothetical protein
VVLGGGTLKILATPLPGRPLTGEARELDRIWLIGRLELVGLALGLVSESLGDDLLVGLVDVPVLLDEHFLELLHTLQ